MVIMGLVLVLMETVMDPVVTVHTGIQERGDEDVNKQGI